MSPIVLASDEYEKKFWEAGKKLICGIDEVGRGCFAGPVVAGAVVFESTSQIPQGLADSNLLLPKKRKNLVQTIMETATCWAVAVSDVDIINKSGIGKAAQCAFVKSMQSITVVPDQILIHAFYIAGLAKSNQPPIRNG